MAKKSGPNYEALTLAEHVEEPHQAPPTTRRPLKQPTAKAGRTLKEVSAPHIVYLHPGAAKTLKRYAVDQNVKVHDLMIEALEDWFKGHGLKGPIRADTTRRE
jgi:hypothetical protein